MDEFAMEEAWTMVFKFVGEANDDGEALSSDRFFF